MPDWWGAFLGIVVGGILLVVFVVGLTRMVKYLLHETKGFSLLVMLSLLLVPAMFSTCTTINLASEDEARDAFGFERPAAEGRTGFETRSMRRARTAENIFGYVTSLHGLVSMATAIVVGIPFMLCTRKVREKKGSVDRIDGYWQVAIPLALIFLILLARS